MIIIELGLVQCRGRQVVAVCGSLRRVSYNMAVLRAAASLAPEGMQIDVRDLRAIPPFDPDGFEDGVTPDVVADLLAAIARADAVILATPEYSHSISAALKNVLEWAYASEPLRQKPVAILTASVSGLGGARAQMHLREILYALEARLLPGTEYRLAGAQRKIEGGELADAAERDALAEFLRKFEAFIADRPRVLS